MKLKDGIKVYRGGVCYKGEIPAHVKKELGKKAADFEDAPQQKNTVKNAVKDENK